MKKMNKLTVAALALAAIGFASTAASAQSVTTSADDLILGFQLPGNPTDLEVDLGAQTLFTQTATINLSSDLSVTDLSNTFGTSWANTTSGTGVQWSVAGNAPGGTSATKNNIDLTSTVAPNGKGTNALGPYFNDIAQETTGTGGIDGAPVAGTSVSALIGTQASPATGIAASYTEISTEYKNLNANVEQTGAGTDELYQYVGAGNTGTVVDLGTFTLGSNGSFTYNGINATATPEPSAYALGICALLLFVVLRRRALVA